MWFTPGRIHSGGGGMKKRKIEVSALKHINKLNRETWHEISGSYFQFVSRKNHKSKCGLRHRMITKTFFLWTNLYNREQRRLKRESMERNESKERYQA